MGIGVPTIQIRANRVDSDVEVNLVSVGFGIHSGWTYAAMYGNDTLFSMPQIGENPFSIFFYASIASFAVALFAIAIADPRIAQTRTRRKIILAACALTSGGTLLMVPMSLTSKAVGFALALGAGVFTGIGSAVLAAAWGVALSVCERGTIIANIALSFVLAICIHAVLLHVIPCPAAGMLTATLPMLEVLILLRGRSECPPASTSDFDFDARPVRKPLLAVKLATPIIIICLGLSLLKNSYVTHIMSANDMSSRLSLVIAAIVTFFVLFISIEIVSKNRDSDAPFRPILCIAAVAATMVPLLGTAQNTAIATVVIIGYFALEAAVYAYPPALSQESRISALFAFGIVRGCMALGMIAASVITTRYSTLPELLPWGSASICVITLMCFLVGKALLPSRASIESAMLAPATGELNFDTMAIERFAPSVAQRDEKECAFSGGEEVPKDSCPTEPREAKESPLDKPSAKDAAEGACSKVDDAANSGNAAKQSGRANPGENAATSACSQAEKAASEPARSVRKGSRSSNLAESDNAKHEDDQPGERPLQKQGLKRKCQQIADRNLLSRRETEVLFELAKGYNCARVQKILVISEGTARTHIRHIYNKLDVHSQQELIKFVEDYQQRR